MSTHDIGLLVDGATLMTLFYALAWLVHNELEDRRDRKVLAATRARIAAIDARADALLAKAEERAE